MIQREGRGGGTCSDETELPSPTLCLYTPTPVCPMRLVIETLTFSRHTPIMWHWGKLGQIVTLAKSVSVLQINYSVADVNNSQNPFRTSLLFKNVLTHVPPSTRMPFLK